MACAPIEEQEMIVAIIRRFVEEEINPNEDEVERICEARPKIPKRMTRKTNALDFLHLLSFRNR